MFAALRNTPRVAAWGSTTAIAELLGGEPSGRPEAELWFGAHHVSPARFVGAVPGGHATLAEWVAEHGVRDAATGERWLPFLLKVLAADRPLSLQAHPTAAQARAGYDRETGAGVSLDAPERNYRDRHPKPELLVAVSERFDALAGFRDPAETRALFAELGEQDAAARLTDLPGFVAWLLSGGDGVTELVERVSRSDFADADTQRLVHDLAEQHPGDPGIVLALALNRVNLRRGEALYVPAGMIHAYLSGVGIELMTASDNVLRGGLTVKNVDVPALLEVLDCTPGPAPLLEPRRLGDAHDVYYAWDAAPRLEHLTGPSELELRGAAIALCIEGEFELVGRTDSASVARGQALFVTADESPLTVTGAGELFLASAVSVGT